MINQSNVTHIVIGKDDDIITAAETRDDLIAGQIGVFLVGSTIGKVDALVAGDRFRIAYKRNDGAVVESPVIEYSNILNKNAEGTPAAATNQVRALGFNGTTGSIDDTNSEDYVVHYVWYDNTKSLAMGKPVKFLAYRSDASTSQVEIAVGLAQNAVVNNSKEVYPIIKPRVLINDAGAVITGTGNLTAVQDSKYLTAATDADAVVSVGDYLRLGTAAGAVLTDDCYRVVSFPSGGQFIELDRAFQGASATYTEANCDYIAAATAASAAAGVTLDAQTMPFDPGIKKYSQVNFDFWKVGEGFGSTTVSEVTKASKGVGTYAEIAEIEWFLRGNRGETFRVAAYPVSYTPDADSTKTYQQIVVSYKDTNVKTLDYEPASYGAILIATEDESASTVHTDLKTVLGIS
jgi:hypothetical protein